ncbi:hypothetical protein Cgig2_010017 [Carnegiea gigantea]|uniref:Ubiquitinyl hydrolase 1 n=1 Tax=Carnegiea gigantea TaxID=171969 RepID=A0A9Q1Q5G8_9CARY|nr:hypothetical protein Cgig2_010017 [Carnegiea gigantea]
MDQHIDMDQQTDMDQLTANCAEEAQKIPFVGDKEPISALAVEYQSGSPILLEKIKEHILETQDRAEVERVKVNVEECRKTLQSLGYADFTFEDFFAFCKSSVEPMGEESDHVHIIALSDTLGVPIRVVYLDRSSCDTGVVSVNHHDFIPVGASNVTGVADSAGIKPYITLLYRPGHYDILYPKECSSTAAS